MYFAVFLTDAVMTHRHRPSDGVLSLHTAGNGV